DSGRTQLALEDRQAAERRRRRRYLGVARLRIEVDDLARIPSAHAAASSAARCFCRSRQAAVRAAALLFTGGDSWVAGRVKCATAAWAICSSAVLAAASKFALW